MTMHDFVSLINRLLDYWNEITDRSGFTTHKINSFLRQNGAVLNKFFYIAKQQEICQSYDIAGLKDYMDYRFQDPQNPKRKEEKELCNLFSIAYRNYLTSYHTKDHAIFIDGKLYKHQ